MEAPIGYQREKITDQRLRSTCKKCGEVFIGTVGKALADAEWDHAERCRDQACPSS